jgi:hypothetical protein
MTPPLRRGRVRGIRRKRRGALERIAALVKDFPAEDTPGCGYWHAHLPLSRDFIDSPRTPRGVRRATMQALLDAADHLRLTRKTIGGTRVVAAIDLPFLFDSQLIVFFGESHWTGFFDRRSDDQTWTKLPPSRSLAREWSLIVPRGMVEQGYREVIRDEDYEHTGEVWFVGELS